MVVLEFREKRSDEPVNSGDDTAWEREIEAVDRAVMELLNCKRKVLRENPQREQVLHMRHIARLRRIKRHVDALCV